MAFAPWYRPNLQVLGAFQPAAQPLGALISEVNLTERPSGYDVRIAPSRLRH